MRQARIGWTFLVTGLAAFMVAMDSLVVTNALPVIRVALDTGLEGLEWTVNAYTLTFAVFLLTGAALGDRFGRRRLFTLGMAIFTLSSVVAALAPSVGALIAARAVQGVGSAIVTPLSLTLLVEAVPAARRGLAIGIFGAMSGLAIGLGPLIGGAVVEYSSWQWIFWINVPIGLILIPLTRHLPESRGGSGRLDPLGLVLATIGLFGLVFGLVRGGGHGWSTASVLVALVGGTMLVLAFLGWQGRVAHPMMPLTMFRSRGFSVVSGVAFLMAFGMFGLIFLAGQFFQTVQGHSPLEAGVRTLPWTAAPALVAPLSGVLVDRLGARGVLATALALQAAGVGWLAVVTRPDLPYADFVAPYGLAGIGMGLFFAPLARSTVGFAPQHLVGVASGTSNALRQLGTVLGIAVLGMVFTAAGGYGSGPDFVGGLRVASVVAAAVLAGAALLALAIPRLVPAASSRASSAAADSAAEPPAAADSGRRSLPVSR